MELTDLRPWKNAPIDSYHTTALPAADSTQFGSVEPAAEAIRGFVFFGRGRLGQLGAIATKETTIYAID